MDRSLHPYRDAIAVREPSGQILVDNVTVADTLQCVHCGGHWVPRTGSGRVRGYCSRCNGPVCGRKCAVCVPLERWLDTVERAGERTL